MEGQIKEKRGKEKGSRVDQLCSPMITFSLSHLSRLIATDASVGSAWQGRGDMYRGERELGGHSHWKQCTYPKRDRQRVRLLGAKLIKRTIEAATMRWWVEFKGHRWERDRWGDILEPGDEASHSGNSNTKDFITLLSEWCRQHGKEHTGWRRDNSKSSIKVAARIGKADAGVQLHGAHHRDH